MARILVIDDDQDILDFLSTCLADSHDVTACLNGELASYAMEEHAFDIIITDIFMPFRDGLDITREVTTLYPNTKVIAMTSHYGQGQTDYLKAAEVIGAAGQLRKPLTVEEVTSVVDQVLGAEKN